MNDLDRQIEEALDSEDKKLLKEFGEQGLLAQSFSVFQGKQGWIAGVAAVMGFVISAAAVFSAWKFFNASDAVEATQWGVGAWLLMTMVGFMKLWFWMRMESNRVIREVKRVELQLARMQTKNAA